MKKWACVLGLPLLFACSAKSPTEPTQPAKRVEKASPAPPTTEAKTDDPAPTVVQPRTFFSNLQILIEVEAAENVNCDPRVRLEEMSEAKFSVASERGQLLSGEDLSDEAFVLNLRLQTIGFDRIQMKKTVKASDEATLPYGIRFQRRGGQLEMIYLGERFPLNLRATPVYSLSVKEVRSACELTHSINLFAEDAKLFSF